MADYEGARRNTFHLRTANGRLQIRHLVFEPYPIRPKLLRLPAVRGRDCSGLALLRTECRPA